MSLWRRIANVFRNEASLNREIDEELASHIDEAVAEGRDPGEARRAFGSLLSTREESRDVRLVAWLDSLRADAVFGWRQLLKNKVTSAAAILSLALAIGACTSAFRLIDALLFRPLPVSHPEELYSLTRYGIGFDGKPTSFDGWSHPAYLEMQAAVRNRAELIAISYAEQTDLTYSNNQEIERAWLQYVSGSMFSTFGLEPALGRLLTGNDDLKPGAHPLAVISYDYWTRRFGQDRGIVGRTFHIGGRVYEIIGVAPKVFTGTETGIATDLFVPAMMNPRATSPDTTWHRTLARIAPGEAIEPIRARLEAVARAIEQERSKGFTDMSKEAIARYLDQRLEVEPASSGASDLQRQYRTSLAALGVLVALVLLIACANVANLMTAQAAARAREMALRVSIGAGRWRLIQLVLVESAWISALAVVLGGAFAWWSAPFVVNRINPPDNPARLALPWDWRLIGFGVALALIVTILFGLVPALRASSVRPSAALKGGDDPHSRRRLMHVLIAAQVAFCFVVLFVAGLFTASFERLSHRPTGFSADRLLVLDTVAHAPQSPLVWEQLAEHMQTLPGVESAALAAWPLMVGYARNSFIAINGGPPSQALAYFLNVSPSWLDTMKVERIGGRGFRPDDTFPSVAIVNETFAKVYFHGENPVGRTFEKTYGGAHAQTRIVGLVRDAIYRNLREPMLPVAYIPFTQAGPSSEFLFDNHAALMIKTAAANPLSMAHRLRQEVTRERPDFHVSTVRTQEEINQAQTVRERLLAALALFFAMIAVLLAGVGLYGVLDYSVLQRRREIGIRMAIGAPAGNIARIVTTDGLAAVAVGSAAGLGLGIAGTRYVASLVYQVDGTDPAMLAIPSLAIVVAALLAAAPAVIRAIRLDPVDMLRSE